jgi:hypothetical protein
MGKDIDLEISGVYAWNELDLSKLVEAASIHVLPFVGSLKHFTGSTKTGSFPAQRTVFRMLEPWREAVLALAPNVLLDAIEIQAWGARRVSMFLYPARKEVSLTIGTNSEEEVEAKKILGVVISALALVPATVEKALEGEARRYFIEDSVDENWFNRLADVVQSFVTTKASFRGDYWVGEQKFSKGKLEEWCNEARSRWNDVGTLHCWCWLSHSLSTLDIDLLRQTLKLELQRPSPDLLREDFSQLGCIRRTRETRESVCHRFLRSADDRSFRRVVNRRAAREHAAASVA